MIRTLKEREREREREACQIGKNGESIPLNLNLSLP